MKKTKMREMAQMAVLTAIILIMALTPLGNLWISSLELSLITILFSHFLCAKHSACSLTGIFT